MGPEGNRPDESARDFDVCNHDDNDENDQSEPDSSGFEFDTPTSGTG